MTVKQVAVTGAGRGIGLAVAGRFLDAGWRVWALTRRPEAMEPLRTRGDVHRVPFDAGLEDPVLEAARRLPTQAGHLSALVNDAGIALSAPLHETSTAEYERVMTVNVTAPFVLLRELAPAMAKAGHGRVVNVASVAVLRGLEYGAASCASKHALLYLLCASEGAKAITGAHDVIDGGDSVEPPISRRKRP